jgi:hypothetical protein
MQNVLPACLYIAVTKRANYQNSINIETSAMINHEITKTVTRFMTRAHSPQEVETSCPKLVEKLSMAT